MALFLPALVPVGSKKDEDLPAVVVQVGQSAGETILQRLLDARVCGLEALKHVQVLLAIFKVLGQEAKRLEVLKLPGPQKPQDEGIVGAEEADVRPGDDHVPHLLDVLVQGVGVLVQFQPGFLQSLRGETCLQMSHGAALLLLPGSAACAPQPPGRLPPGGGLPRHGRPPLPRRTGPRPAAPRPRRRCQSVRRAASGSQAAGSRGGGLAPTLPPGCWRRRVISLT